MQLSCQRPTYMMQGCHTPPSPTTPWYPPLPVLALLLSPSGLVWPRPLPPCGVGPVVFLVGPAPPVGGSVFYRGMVWLLPLVSSTSDVIITCLVPSPPCGAGPVVVLVGPAPPVWGSVFYRDMVWLLPSVSSNVIVTCSLLLFSPCKRCRCPCSDAALRSCEEALAGIILRPPSLWFAWVRSGCGWEQGRPGGTGASGREGGGGGGGVAARDPRPYMHSPQPRHTCI